MKKSILLISALATFMAISCSKNELNNYESGVDNSIKVYSAIEGTESI